MGDWPGRVCSLRGGGEGWEELVHGTHRVAAWIGHKQ